METTTILLILLLSIGAVQGIIFGIVLIRKRSPNQIANRLLAAILLLLSYRLVIQTMRLFGLGYYDTWYYFMLDISWLTPPLLFFYVKAQITPGFQFLKKDRIHFLPVIFQIVFSEFVRIQNIYWDGTRESLSWLGCWGYVVWMNNSTIYVVASVLIIIYSIKAEKILSQPPENVILDKSRIKWLDTIIRSFKIYFSIVLLILLLDFIFYKINYDNSYFYFIRFYYYPFFIGLSVLTYWVGLQGFLKKDDEPVSQKVPMSKDERDKLEEIDRKISKAMIEDKLFMDSNLTLNSAANSIKVKPYLLTKSLNEIQGKKFNDFLNEYRIKEVQSLMKNPENKKFTLLAIAMEAGFNSKSSFNRAVKKHLGILPNELKDLK